MTGTPIDHALNLPMGSIIQSLSGRKQDAELFYYYSSFITPGMIMKYDFKHSKGKVFKQVQVNDYVSDEFKVEQVFYSSEDGTRIPMFIISKKVSLLLFSIILRIWY